MNQKVISILIATDLLAIIIVMATNQKYLINNPLIQSKKNDNIFYKI